MVPTRYDQFVRHIFARTKNPWGWTCHVDHQSFEAEDVEIVELVLCLLRRSHIDLSDYSDFQVSHGLSLLFENSWSDTVFSLKSEAIPKHKKLQVIAAFYSLYSEVFAKRCAPILSHLDEPGGTPLNATCYMLWDVTPLSYWESDSESQEYYSALVSMLARVLSLHHVACVESALHGLGHLQSYCPTLVEETIDGYLAARAIPSPALRLYAEQARTGYLL